MKNLEIAFFALTTLLVLLGGVFTVAAKTPVRGAMGLLATILGIAGMYLLLSAELLAADFDLSRDVIYLGPLEESGHLGNPGPGPARDAGGSAHSAERRVAANQT